MKKLAVLFVCVVACAAASWADLIDDRVFQPRGEVELPKEKRLQQCQRLGFETPQNKHVWAKMKCDTFSPQELAANLTREKRLVHCARLTDYPADRPENSWYNCSEFSQEELLKINQKIKDRKMYRPINDPRAPKTQNIKGQAPEVPFVKEKVAKGLNPAEEKSEAKPATKPAPTPSKPAGNTKK